MPSDNGPDCSECFVKEGQVNTRCKITKNNESSSKRVVDLCVVHEMIDSDTFQRLTFLKSMACPRRIRMLQEAGPAKQTAQNYKATTLPSNVSWIFLASERTIWLILTFFKVNQSEVEQCDQNALESRGRQTHGAKPQSNGESSSQNVSRIHVTQEIFDSDIFRKVTMKVFTGPRRIRMLR